MADLSSLGQLVGGAGNDLGSAGVSSTIINGFTPQMGIMIVMWVFALGLIGISGWIVFNITRKWATTVIFEVTSNGTMEIKKDIIRKIKHNKTKDIVFKLAKFKDTISADTARMRYRLKNGYMCPLMRGEDGQLRPLRIIKDYVDDNGNLQPYMHPVDNNLKDHIWHDMKMTTQKYKLTSTMEKLAPYATFALVAIMSMMMWYVTNGR